MTRLDQVPHICIEASPAVHEQAGLGRYTEGLINGLLSVDPHGSYSIAYNHPGTDQPQMPFNALPAFTSRLGTKQWRLRNALTYFGAPRMDEFVPGISIYHSTGHLLPRFHNVRTVFTLHDLIPLLFPEYHLPMNRIFLQLMFPRFLRHADAIIAVSEQTRHDANRLLKIPPDRISVIPEAPAPHFQPVNELNELSAVRAKFNLPKRFILYLATIEPRKNHATLLDAYGNLIEKFPDTPLVLAGEPGWLFQDFFNKLSNSGLHRNVILTGKVPDADLPALLSAATVFACPSLYEGFGLPPLEAMACGTAVICSNSSSLPEATGNAAVLVDPLDVRGWSGAIENVLQNEALQTDLEMRGLAHSKRFTWEATARATMRVYDRVLHEN